MPAKTHNEMRAIVCLVCSLKGSSPRKITGKNLERVTTYYLTNYNPEDVNFPSHICDRCRKLLENIEKGKNKIEDLPEPIDMTQVKLPSPRMETRTSSVQNKKLCDCYICEIGRVNARGVGPTVPHKMGRPPTEGPDRLPARMPITRCERCKGIMKKGVSHPENCGITEFRENVREMIKSDPKLAEMIASDLIKEKAATQPNSPTFSLSTAGPSRQLTVANPYLRSAKRALFPNSPVPASEVMKLKTDGGFTTNQMELFAKTTRSWKGRDMFESYLTGKIKDMSHVVEPYYSSTTIKLDDHNKKIRDEFGPVDRVIVYCNDILSTNQLICNARGYSDIADTFFRLSADAGGGSFKVNGTIESLVDDTDPSTIKKQKWSYAHLADKFKDSGVKRQPLYGNSKSYFSQCANRQKSATTTIFFFVQL